MTRRCGGGLMIGDAIAPTAAAVLHTVTGSYPPMFIAVGACSLTTALLFAAADRVHRKARARPV